MRVESLILFLLGSSALKIVISNVPPQTCCIRILKLILASSSLCVCLSVCVCVCVCVCIVPVRVCVCICIVPVRVCVCLRIPFQS